jgi:pimeloyl-ACP methyl ester carboxylesterase
MDRTRRGILATVAATAAAGAAGRTIAQQEPTDVGHSFYERGGVRIRYRETGSGFPVLVVPGGGLNSRMAGWPNYPINAMEAFQGDFRCITMDQRNANGGESSGPVPTDRPWDAFADDQLGLMDHLGIRQFMFFGNCIGGSFGLKLMERAPGRLVAAVLSQPIGHRPETPDVMYNSGRDGWGPEFRKRRPEVSVETIDTYLHSLYRTQPDFVYSVSRDFVRTCATPMLVLPDDTAAHPHQTSVDIASLAPRAEISVYPWTKPPELKARTSERVRAFLQAHQT